MRSSELSPVVWVPVLVIAIIGVGVLALPSHRHDHVPAYEAAAAATLKSGILPAEIQFQAMPLLDQDQNGVGEYALLSELSGRRGVGRLAPGEVRLLTGPLAKGDVSSRYRFVVYLPDGNGGAFAEPATPGPRSMPSKASLALQERHFIAYAWPADAASGRYMFAITESGVVRYAPRQDHPPSWNAAMGDKGWDADLAWPPFAR
jgi:hypothetical protein